MKNGVLFVYGLFTAMAGGLVSCEGDQGPVGPAGPTSESTCIECHANNQKIAVKEYQWEHSVHATGGNNNHNATNCAICHTSQGFVERIAPGANMKLRQRFRILYLSIVIPAIKSILHIPMRTGHLLRRRL